MSISKPQLNNIVHAFQPILNKKCWALSLQKKPWNYDKGYCLEWSDTDLLLTFWEATDKLYDRSTHGAGLGIFLGENNKIGCLDLDGVITDEKTPKSEDAQRIIKGSCTFTETSVSGTGLHLFFEIDPDTKQIPLRKGICERDGVFYTQKHFIRLTGNIFGKEYPVRYLPPHHFEYFREQFGKAPVLLPAVIPFTGKSSDRSLSARLTTACIPFRSATITPQPYHAEHGGVIEVVETICPNVAEHTSEATPYAKFARCADGFFAGRCLHAHCEPEILRAAGTSLAGMLSAKMWKAGDPNVVFSLLEKCEKMGMKPINGNEVSRMGYPAVVKTCQKFLSEATC